MSTSSSKRLLAYGVGVLALGALVFYLRSGGGDSAKAKGTTASQPPAAGQAAASGGAATPARPTLAKNGTPKPGVKPPVAAPRAPGDGSDIVVPKNTFGHDLPPPALPPADYMPPERPKVAPLTHEQKQKQRRQIADVLERRIAALETQIKGADDTTARRLRLRLTRMKQHRARKLDEIKRRAKDGEPASGQGKPVDGQGTAPRGDGHDH